MNTRLIRLRRSFFGLTSYLLRHLLVILFLLILSGGVYLGLRAKNFMNDLGLGHLSLLTFFTAPDKILNSTNGRTNFLIMGVRGQGSDSPDLTDTMLVVSYSHQDKAATLISIPRDLWVDSLKTKINSVYHYGKFKDENGGGIKLAQSAILETLGLPIHYSIVIDFSFFEKAVSLVGGVDINVQTAFTDTQFPVAGKENALPIESRFETITFNSGWQHMDGVTALKFVRSRHAPGDEGTDIARDRRQQQVVTALKQKILNLKFLLNRKNLIGLYSLVKENTDTNINENIYPTLVRLAFDSYRQQTKEIILNYVPDEAGFAILENPPVSPTYLNQWVLIARDKNWPALAQYIQNKLSGKQ